MNNLNYIVNIDHAYAIIRQARKRDIIIQQGDLYWSYDALPSKFNLCLNKDGYPKVGRPITISSTRSSLWFKRFTSYFEINIDPRIKPYRLMEYAELTVNIQPNVLHAYEYIQLSYLIRNHS